MNLKSLLARAFVSQSGRISTARVCGVLCYVTACGLALWRPDAAGTVTALCGAGAVAIATRKSKETT